MGALIRLKKVIALVAVPGAVGHVMVDVPPVAPAPVMTQVVVPATPQVSAVEVKAPMENASLLETVVPLSVIEDADGAAELPALISAFAVSALVVA